jgi:nicotinamide-nucleotide amidase
LSDKNSTKSALKEIRDILISSHETISVAESVTAGLLQAALASASDATMFFEGGITTYNARQKVRHLGIDPVHALKHNCVSEQVAGEMALGAARIFITNWAIGVTGYATTLPESGINSLFAFFAIAFNGKIVRKRRIEADGSDPESAQAFYVDSIIDELTHCLKVSSDAARAS